MSHIGVKFCICGSDALSAIALVLHWFVFLIVCDEKMDSINRARAGRTLAIKKK